MRWLRSYYMWVCMCTWCDNFHLFATLLLSLFLCVYLRVLHMHWIAIVYKRLALTRLTAYSILHFPFCIVFFCIVIPCFAFAINCFTSFLHVSDGICIFVRSSECSRFFLSPRFLRLDFQSVLVIISMQTGFLMNITWRLHNLSLILCISPHCTIK